MDGIGMSGEVEKKKMGGESEGGAPAMSGRQVFWGVLMSVSLFVMVAGAFLSAGAGRKPAGEAGPSYRAAGGKAGGAGFAAFFGRMLGMASAAGRADAGAVPDGGTDTLPDEKDSGGDTPAGAEAAKRQDGEAQDADAPVIAFTFDDGPFTKVTDRIVDVLLAYDAGATFFVVGSRVDMYSDTLKRVYESGFEVGSHTWSHKNLNGLSEEEILKELGDTQEVLSAYIPVGKVLLRPPYGSADKTVRGLAGTALINWSLDSEDWKSRDADAVIEHVLSTVKDGDIILMHDLYECTAEAVEYLVPELVARGYRIVSVSELFECKDVPLEEGILYRNPFDSY